MIMSLVYLYTSYIVHFEYWLLSIAYWCKVGIKLELSSSLKCKLHYLYPMARIFLTFIQIEYVELA